MNNVSIKLSEHFTLAEMCKTNVKLKNVPNEAQVENLKRLCGWLEMLRSEWNRRYGEGNDPIIINSGYRSPAVNKAVGGVATSNHLTLSINLFINYPKFRYKYNEFSQILCKFAF